VAFSQPCAIIPSIAHVFLIGQILLAQFVDIANSNLKIQYVVFAKQRRISGCVLSVGLLAAEGTRKDMPEGTGRRQSIAIHLSLKHNVFGIMLVTIMFTGLFNPKLMAS
jgi:hypothetical protein